MARRKLGGGIFKDDITGDWTGIARGIFTILVLGLLATAGYFIYLAVVAGTPSSGDSSEPNKLGPGGTQKRRLGPGGTPFVGPTGPGMNTIPGRITIAQVGQSPSAGQGVIYFSQAEAEGATCDTCTGTFDIQLKYTGGLPTPPPKFTNVSAGATSGTVTFDYSVPTQTGGGTSPTPTPPTQVTAIVSARSVNPSTGNMGPATTFTKTMPYV